MTTTSTIPAFKDALVSRLAADSGLSGVQVVRLDPFPSAPAVESVIIARAQPQDRFVDGIGGGQTSRAIGRRAREERYVVEVVCRVTSSIQQVTGAAVIEDRAYELAAVVQQSIDAWAGESPQFGGVVGLALVVGTEDWHGNDDQKREARVTVSVGCRARINI